MVAPGIGSHADDRGLAALTREMAQVADEAGAFAVREIEIDHEGLIGRRFARTIASAGAYAKSVANPMARDPRG